MTVDTSNSIYQYIPSRATIRDCLPFIGVFTPFFKLEEMSSNSSNFQEFEVKMSKVHERLNNNNNGSASESNLPDMQKLVNLKGKFATLKGIVKESNNIVDNHIETCIKQKATSRNAIISQLLTIACSIALFVKSWIFIFVGIVPAYIAWKTLPLHWEVYFSMGTIEKESEELKNL